MNKRKLMRLWFTTWMIVMVACSAAPSTPPPAPTATLPPTPEPTATTFAQPFSAVKIQSDTIAKNILGGKTEQTITVYLPPSYNTYTNIQSVFRWFIFYRVVGMGR